MHHQGVFRVSGSQHEINEFRNQFEQGTFMWCSFSSIISEQFQWSKPVVSILWSMDPWEFMWACREVHVQVENFFKISLLWRQR